ncbi:MAG: glycosyltransferase [Mobilicoccus sp.]|nr:glycosyltransferase [Mobilicoccus sp.]
MSYRRADLLRAALTSVAEHLPDSTVLVWDNASDGSDDVRILSDSWPSVEWTFCDENIGFAAAVNRLVAQSSAPTFFLMNPDAVLVGDLQGCRRALEDPQVAAAAPWMEDGRHRPWDNAHREPTAIRMLVSYAGWENRLARRPGVSMAYRSQPTEVSGYLTGAGLMISRDAWRAVGEFDERYFLYGEEADWCRRARHLGRKLCAIPEPGIVHHAAGTVSDETAASSKSTILLNENRRRYLRSHHGALSLGAFVLGARALDAAQPSKRRQRRGQAPDYVITSPTLDFGGAERQRVALANGLAEAGERVVLRLLQGRGGLDEFVSPAVEVQVAPWQAVRRDAGPHTLLVTGTTRIELAYGTAWRALNVPHGRWVVANHHPADDLAPVFTAPDAAMMRRSDGMLYLADVHRRDHSAHQRLDRGRYWIVPNGIDVSRFAPGPPEPGPGPRTIVSVSRLAGVKQVPLLVEALSSLPHLDWVFDIWGDGPERETIAASIPEELEDRIRLRGWCSDVPAVLSTADLFCTASRAEAQPMANLEAMAAGVPVASSAVASVPEMLADGAGVIVDPNTVENWAAQFEALLTDPPRLRALGLAGRARVEERYSETAMIRNYRQVRNEVLTS